MWKLNGLDDVLRIYENKLSFKLKQMSFPCLWNSIQSMLMIKNTFLVNYILLIRFDKLN